MKQFIHFTSLAGKIVTANINELVLEVDEKEKKASVKIGYKDYEISQQDALDITQSLQKDCSFILNKTNPPTELLDELFQIAVKQHFLTPVEMCCVNEKQFNQTLKEIVRFFAFTLEYCGYDPNKCNATQLVEDYLLKLRELRRKMMESAIKQQEAIAQLKQDKDQPQESVPAMTIT